MRAMVFGVVFAAGLGSASYAADLPVRAAPPAQQFQTTYAGGWTGFYLGGEVGYGWASSTQTNIDATGAFLAGSVLNANTPSGALGGIYGGYNYQLGQYLVGIDGNFDWASLTGGDATTIGNTAAVGGRTHVGTEKVKSLATLTGRLGYVLNPNWMIFGKGGWAWSSWSGTGITTNATTGAVTSTGTNSTNRNGWTLGVGTEWQFAAHWTAKLEYDYVNFSTVNYNTTDTSAAGLVTTPARSATSFMNVVKVGLGYLF